MYAKNKKMLGRCAGRRPGAQASSRHLPVSTSEIHIDKYFAKGLCVVLTGVFQLFFVSSMTVLVSAQGSMAGPQSDALGPVRVLVSTPDAELNHLSWPKVTRTTSGTLVLAYSAGIGHNVGRSGLAVSRSIDGGKTFTPPRLLKVFPDNDPLYRDCGNLAIGMAHDGAVVILAMAYDGNTRHTIIGYRSTDDAETWQRVDTNHLGNSRTGSVYGHIFAVDHDTLAVAGHYRPGSSTHEQGIWLAYSKDQGQSWGKPQRIVEQRLQEPAMVYTRLGYMGLIRSWGGDATDYTQLTSTDGEHWQAKRHAMNTQVARGHSYPSPFVAVDPKNPNRLWALKSTRGPRRGIGAIALWTADLAEIDDIAKVTWEKSKDIIHWTGEDGHHVDFTYPWMAHLQGNRWMLVFYSGQRRGMNDIHGLTLHLDPLTGQVHRDSQVILNSESSSSD